MKRSKGRRVAVGLAVLAIVVLGLVTWKAWPIIAFWWRFEELGENADGLLEFRHRNTGMTFVQIPGGRFRMGLDDPNELASIQAMQNALVRKGLGIGVVPDVILKHRQMLESPSHEVELSPFLIGLYEVTQAEWKKVVGSTPWSVDGDDLPVSGISWDDCNEFCARTGLMMPTEAQWEYACRAGDRGPFGGAQSLDEVAWYKANAATVAGYRLSPVGKKKPNGFGLFDMLGNVREWCQDAWDPEFYSKPEAGQKDPVCRSGEIRSGLLRRVIRGGSSGLDPLACRSAFRIGSDPTERGSDRGFRPTYWPLPR